MCGGNESSTSCTLAWTKSVDRAIWGYQWTRMIETNLVNNTGDVVRSKYCANRGSGVHSNDTQHCCSSRSRGAYPWENIARPSLKICE
ncbi:MAG: hypothetical protein DCF27_03705 [Lysobacteraceae bacterium]|nr:MAG: hypothetical protein DCF27_03705 [Xanthomonadaceae bacterium]